MGKEHFDETAETWDDDPDKLRRSREIAQAIQAAVPLTSATRLLEYGAGTGLVTQGLQDRVGRVTLADNSSGMRAVLHRKLESGVFPEGTRVWDLDLENQPAPTERFDLIVSSMVLHHVHALDTVLAGLVGMLEPGGHLCLTDLDREDGSFHQHDFDGHHGFDRRELATALDAAGLPDVTFEDCGVVVRDGVEYGVFLAMGRARGA